MNTTLHIYTRVSSIIQQEEGTSLENQRQLGIKKASELGFDFRLWNEGGQSSFHDDLNNRPALVSLLALIESGAVKHLFVYNADRLSRNQQTWAVIRYKLLAYGVTLHTASGQMKLKNPVDDLMLGILSEISQYDNRIRAERSRLGRFHKVQQGNWKGGPPPFGYRLSNRRLEVDPFECEWVHRIYDWYCHGVAVKEIQSRLSRQGVMTRRGNAQWSLGSIQLILRNPVYAGYFDYTDKMLGESVRIQTPIIIDPHLFQIAQDKRKATREHKHQVNPRKHFYLLRGVLACGHCGSPMGGRTHKAGHQHVYYCVHKERAWKTRADDHPKWKRGTGCSMVRSINIERTDQLVWKMIKGILQQIRDGSPTASTLADLERSDLDDRAGFLTDGITWMSPEQIDLLSDEEKRIVVGKAVSGITATFDVETKKHCLEVAYSEVIVRRLADVMGRSRRSSDRVVLALSEPVSEGSSLVMDVSGDACDDLSIGQQQLGDRARSFGDGGVGPSPPPPIQT
jgi:DNA invertase Pin-like site-specific DNA recombinase